MARFYGPIGYGTTLEDANLTGVWEDEIYEEFYSGMIIREARKLEPGEQLNDEISVVNRISIIANQYANQNFVNIKYVGWNGVLWTVTNVEVQTPRLILSLGKVYNGPTG